MSEVDTTSGWHSVAERAASWRMVPKYGWIPRPRSESFERLAVALHASPWAAFEKASEERAMDGDYVFLCGSDLPSLRNPIGLDRLEELSDERLARMDDDIKKFLHACSPMRSAGWELLRR